MKALEELEAHTPQEVAALSALPGIGPKRMRVLREALGISSLAALRQAAAEGRIRALPGFGRGFEAKLLEAAQRAGQAPQAGR
jgi:DNA polymerase (family 10)